MEYSNENISLNKYILADESGSLSSNIPEDTSPSLTTVKEKLEKNNEIHNLRKALESSLTKSGWKLQVLNLARAAVQKNKNMTFHELADTVREEAIKNIPDMVHEEMEKNIKDAYQKDLPTRPFRRWPGAVYQSTRFPRCDGC